MEVLSAICFNGQLYTEASEAVLFRDTHANSRTQFLDEVERLWKTTSVINSILNSGYAKSGNVPRLDTRGKLKQFNTYSPKMFAGIQRISDTLTDRSIKVLIVKKLKDEKIKRYIVNNQTMELQVRLRDDLYLFGLKYANEIAKLYETHVESFQALDHLSNRKFDIWIPMILLADIVDIERGDQQTTIRDEMISYSESDVEYQKVLDAETNETCKLLTALIEIVNDWTPMRIENDKDNYYSSDDVFEFISNSGDFKDIGTKTKLTQKLKKLDVSCEVKNIDGNSTRLYKINLDSLKDLTARYVGEV
jgi:energy-converting hydrogenase A subunit M